MTSTDIVNLALGKLGANLITSIETDPAGPVLALHYDQALQTQLRRHPWNFATSDPLDLASVAIPEPKPSLFDYLHALPGDFLKRQSLATNRVPIGDTSFAIHGNRVWSLYESLTLVYTVKTPDLVQALPDFIEALGTLLASKLARPILQSNNDARDHMKSWLKIDLPSAIAEDVGDSPGSMAYQARSAEATSPLVQSRWRWHSARAQTPGNYGVNPPS